MLGLSSLGRLLIKPHLLQHDPAAGYVRLPSPWWNNRYERWFKEKPYVALALQEFPVNPLQDSLSIEQPHFASSWSKTGDKHSTHIHPQHGGLELPSSCVKKKSGDVQNRNSGPPFRVSSPVPVPVPYVISLFPRCCPFCACVRDFLRALLEWIRQAAWSIQRCRGGWAWRHYGRGSTRGQWERRTGHRAEINVI